MKIINPRTRLRHTFIVAIYEIDRQYGGPEEGGWWYNTGTLERIKKVFTDEETAYKYCRRYNDLLHTVQRHSKNIYSLLYVGGCYAAEVYRDFAPQYYPEMRPHYE